MYCLLFNYCMHVCLFVWFLFICFLCVTPRTKLEIRITLLHFACLWVTVLMSWSRNKANQINHYYIAKNTRYGTFHSYVLRSGARGPKRWTLRQKETGFIGTRGWWRAWGESSGSQSGEGSSTGSQSGRQGFGDRMVVRQAGFQRQAGSETGKDSTVGG